MSKLFFILDLCEVETEKDGAFKSEYEVNLPHANEITARVSQRWNALDWGKIFDGELAGQVECSKMHSVKTNDGICRVKITTEFATGFRLSEKRRNAFWEQMNAQMSDGWGECVFGPGNPMEFADGRFGYIE